MQYGKYISNSHMHREVSKLERYFFALKGKFGKKKKKISLTNGRNL
jgi:hypothetical protein